MINFPADVILRLVLILLGVLIVTVIVFTKNEKKSDFLEKVLDFIHDMAKSA